MPFKKSLIILLCLLFFILPAGCKTGPNEAPAPPEENPPGQQVPPPSPSESLEITDYAELKALWEEYLYDSIVTVGNTGNFSSPSEIHPLFVAEFCWKKYILEHGGSGLEPGGKEGYQYLFPLDRALSYAKRYFNLSEIDVSEMAEYYYDPQEKAFLFSFDGEEERFSHLEGNPWGYRLGKIVKNPDGTVTATLVRYMSPIGGMVERTQTYTLRPGEGGKLYFASGKEEYINNHLVSITGDYKPFSEITGYGGNFFDGYADLVSMLGEAEGKILLVYAPYEKDQQAALMRLDPETMTVEKKLAVEGNFTLTDVSMASGRIIIRRSDRFTTVDTGLSRAEDVMLPETIAKKTDREPVYNETGTPDVFFGGFDVSRDHSQYVYSDEEGVKLYSAADGGERLLSRTVPVPGSELMDRSFHSQPRFVAGEAKVITTMTGYESAMGYTLCTLATGEVKSYPIGQETSSTGLIRYDTGLLEVNAYVRSDQNPEGDYKTFYLDFHTGEVKEIPLEDPGDTGFIFMTDQRFVAGNFAAFITFRQSPVNNTDDEAYINRLNLKTMALEPKLITVQGASTHLLGVLEDGRVLFWYDLNPSERGLGVTS